MLAVVEAGRFVDVKLGRRDLVDQHEIVAVPGRVAHAARHGGGNEGEVARLDRDPLAAHVDLATAGEAEKGFFRQVVAIVVAGVARFQRQDMHAFGLEAVAGPGDEAGGNAVGRDFDAAVEVADRAAAANLVVAAIPLAITFLDHVASFRRCAARPRRLGQPPSPMATGVAPSWRHIAGGVASGKCRSFSTRRRIRRQTSPWRAA
jgi:hypothetical protein